MSILGTITLISLAVGTATALGANEIMKRSEK